MKRRSLIAGNWKMHRLIPEAEELVCKLKSYLPFPLNTDVVLIPPFTALKSVSELLAGCDLFLGAQNVSAESEGAFTGEISAAMLIDVGCQFVFW